MARIVKHVSLIAAILLCVGCHSAPIKTDSFADESVISLVREHTLSVATIYAMSEAEWQRRVSQPDSRTPFVRWDDIPQEIMPLHTIQQDQDGKPIKFLAYIGSATVLKNDHAITVSHLFDHEANTMGYVIYAFKEGMDHPIECELIVRGDIQENWLNDYAVIRLKEKLGLPGLKIAKEDVKQGDRIIFTGSVGGLAFFTRFGYVTQLQWYFNVGGDGRLHLTPIGPDVFWVCYPGGPGDSGGSVKNCRGEVIGIMYCGYSIYDESYILVNKLVYLHAFLQGASLEYLAQ